jgi:ATP phosphoribosyltransferase regulatory subunit
LVVLRLLLRVLHLARVSNVHLDIGHVGVFRAIVRSARLTGEREGDLFQAVQAKDAAAIARLTRGMPRAPARAFSALPELSGGPRVLATAKRVLPAATGIRRALATLGTLARGLADLDAELGFDLGELRGYRYHSGVVFAAYAGGASTASPNGAAAVALGGRYDEVGKAFGRARPATGFTMDLRALAAAAPAPSAKAAILAPFAPRDGNLQARIAQLRARGNVVIEDLPGHRGQRAELGCDRKLVRAGRTWKLVQC